MVAVGSGGSLAAAHFAVYLHHVFIGTQATAVTPLELIQQMPISRDTTAVFVSAGGANSDILTAFGAAVMMEPRTVEVLCARRDSRLVETAREYPWTTVLEFDLAGGRDGFLATNSLLAFFVLLGRAYEVSVGQSTCLLPAPPWADSHPGAHLWRDTLREESAQLWKRNHTVVLYGAATKPAALDMESKFAEAALGAVLPTDYRNFAHGRHHWLAKRGDSSAVIALASDAEFELAQRTLALLPAEIPSLLLRFPGPRVAAAIEALVAVLHCVGLAGEVKGTDPGRPGVPPFGRRIYHLRMGAKAAGPRVRRPRPKDAAIARKQGRPPLSGREDRGHESWCRAHMAFIRRLQGTLFCGAVFDYDGTLCDSAKRFEAISSGVAGQLVRLLEGGVPLGVVSGRGGSLRDALRSALPRGHWEQVSVGFYNGAQCGSLAADNLPDSSDIPCAELADIVASLPRHPEFLSGVEITVRAQQITVEPLVPMAVDRVWAVVSELARRHCAPGTGVVVSGHSVDVIAPGVTKRALVSQLRLHAGLPLDSPVLCVGDQGQWPGNDYDLLGEPCSLSVDRVSPDPATCWNLAPPGHRGVQATVGYLRCIQTEGGPFTVDPRQHKRSQG